MRNFSYRWERLSNAGHGFAGPSIVVESGSLRTGRKAEARKLVREKAERATSADLLRLIHRDGSVIATYRKSGGRVEVL